MMNQYQILGHLDYPARYLPLTLDSYKKHAALVGNILEILIKRGKALELHTAKLDVEKHFQIMSWIVKAYVDKGGTMVSVGSDAHSTEAIMRNYDKA
jgi:histidinol-phosphatase (PHP family)